MPYASWGIGMSEGSEHKEEAWKLVEYLMSPEVNSKLVTIANAFPGNVKAKPDLSKSDPLFSEAFKIYQEGYLANEFVGLPVAEELMRQMDIEVQKLLEGQATAQEAAHQAVLSHEQQLIARIQMLPDDQLKDAYSSCSQDAIQRTPSYGEIALCSIVYETLLKQVFGGDFDALLAWSRIRAQGAMEDAFAEETVFGMDSSRR